MTIKEIAELTGRSKRTIERWITCDKVSQATCDKVSQAIKDQMSADFTLEETIEILRAGKMSDRIISLLKENANKKGFEFDIKEIITETIKGIIPLVQTMIQENNRLLITQLRQTTGILERPKDKAAYIGEKIAEQIRAKNERKKQVNKTQLYLFEVGE